MKIIEIMKEENDIMILNISLLMNLILMIKMKSFHQEKFKKKLNCVRIVILSATILFANKIFNNTNDFKRILIMKSVTILMIKYNYF